MTPQTLSHPALTLRASRSKAGMAIMVVFALAAAPWIVDPYTLSTVSRMLSLGLLAVSVAVLTGWAGMPTLGQTAPYAIGAYTAAILARHGITTGPAQIIIAAATAAVFSLVIGVAVVRTRGVTFLMTTLAVGELTVAAAGQWTSLTGGTDGLTAIPATQPWPGAAPLIADHAVYTYALAVTGAVIVGVWLVLRSPAGMMLTAIRDHEPRLRASGHPAHHYLLAAYTTAGAIAGVGGALLVTSQRYISPHDISFTISALVLLAVTIGGTTSLTGAVAAVAIVVAVRDIASASMPGSGPALLGLLFLTAVYLLPHGLPGRSLPWRRDLPWQGRRPS